MWILVGVVAVVVPVVVVLASSRVVGPDERLVIYRLGSTDQSLVRGPGRTLILPFVDRAIPVDLRRQRFEYGSVGAATADGQRVGVDVSIELRVVDPLEHVRNLIALDATLPGFIRSVVGEEAAKLALVDARGGRLADAMRARVEEVVAHWGLRLEDLDVTVAPGG